MVNFNLDHDNLEHCRCGSGGLLNDFLIVCILRWEA